MFTAASCRQICLEFRLFTQQYSQQPLVLRYVLSLDCSHSNVHSSVLSAGHAVSVPRPVQLSPKKDAPVRNPPQTKPAETMNKDDGPQGRPLSALVPHPSTSSSITPSSSFIFWKSLNIAFPQFMGIYSVIVSCLYRVLLCVCTRDTPRHKSTTQELCGNCELGIHNKIIYIFIPASYFHCIDTWTKLYIPNCGIRYFN